MLKNSDLYGTTALCLKSIVETYIKGGYIGWDFRDPWVWCYSTHPSKHG